MKRNKFVLTAILTALVSFGVTPANALPDATSAAIRKTLSNVPVLEMAPTGAALVHKALAKDRAEVATTVVRTIVSKRAALATAVVESIAKVAPDLAPAVTATAVELCPDQAAEIAKAAAAAVPEQAGEIAAAAASQSPRSARQVARFAVAASPIEAPQILEAVVASVPSQRGQIENDVTLKVMSVLARNVRASAASSAAARIGKKPLPNPPPTVPTQTTDVAPQARSAAVENAITAMQNLETSSVITDKSLRSAIAIATINTLNVIGRATGITKQEKDSIINATVNTVTTVIALTTAGVTAQTKTDVVKAATQVVATIVSDPGLSDAVRKDYVNFAADALKSIAAITPQANLQTAISAAAAEVTRTIESVRNKTADEAQAGLTKAQENVNNIKKNYGSVN